MPVVSGAIIADVLAKINSEFPINSNLLPAEQTATTAARTKLATCIAEAGLYVVANAEVTTVTTAVQSGSSTAPGTGTLS
jgi:hypothetical protein